MGKPRNMTTKIQKFFNKINRWFKPPIYIFTSCGHERNVHTRDRYNDVFHHARNIAEKLRVIGRKAKNGEYGFVNSVIALEKQSKLTKDLKKIYLSIEINKDKFDNYFIIFGHRIEKHKRISRKLLSDILTLDYEVLKLEKSFCKKEEPKGQKFIPVLDPFGEENWDN